MEVRGRRSKDTSPERIKVCTQPRVMRPTFKRVQVVYYLSRDGRLEHPHYMEVTHLANQPLRLKDVIDRLTILRGKGMPSVYSWSCKRSYKNGYVWNDLAEIDIIYPSEGAEYILKGSELVIDACTEKIEQLKVGNTQQFQQHPLGNTRGVESTNFHPKRKPQGQQEVKNYNQYEDEAEENDDDQERAQDQEDMEEEYEEKTYTSSTPPPLFTRCSRGVSTDELHQQQKQAKDCRIAIQTPISELNFDNASPPSTTSSSLSDKANETNHTSKRYEDGEPVGIEPLLSRNSMLFQLIACGGSVSFRGKNMPVLKQQPQPGRRSNCSDLHKGVLCKSAAGNNKVMEEEDEIKCMSENPRFGNLQAEEKEYFSGSIVESMANEERAQVEPSCLKKSSSHNEERGSKLVTLTEAVAMEEEVKREKALKGKCIPRKKCSSKQFKK